MELDAEAKLSLTLDNTEKAIKDLHEKLKLLAYAPIPRKMIASGTTDATGYALLDFGGPAMGRLWNLTLFTITGNSDSQTIANSLVTLYVGRPVPAVSLADCVVPATNALPNYFTFNKDQVFVSDQEHVFAIVRNAGAAALLTASIRALDYNKAYRWQGL